MRIWMAAFAAGVLASEAALATAPLFSPRPTARATVPSVTTRVSPEDNGLRGWIEGFRSRAVSEGIRPDVYDRAMSNLWYDPLVVERDRNQSEFTKPIWEYLDSAASDTRIRNGRAALERHGSVLDEIEARYGVEKEVVVAVWGLESAYGAYRGETPIIQALATLAYDGRRGRFFEQQLIAALEIVQAGDVLPEQMTGSWAGAMGHTQFIPTSYLAYAVDFRGDGKRDIWSDDPTDALASTAAYLAQFGWQQGQPWGVEVRLPEDFDYGLASRDVSLAPSQWGAKGVAGIDGEAVPDYGQASILLPAGVRGAAFMVFGNFQVIERYNAADAYVIGVGHLSDRIRGGGPIRAQWPRGDRSLVYSERRELQLLLTNAGYATRGVDGRIGPDTVEAIRSYQRAYGLVPDGYASLELLRRLR
jgi:membrane-bound lytic murein transglycosylase B